MNLTQFQQLPILGILRGAPFEIIPALTEAIIRSGLTTVEIAMNTPGAAGQIRQMCDTACGRLTVGAGTVLSLKDLKEAREAGATFVVSPTLVEDVAQKCREEHVPFFPGALTPQEIYNAWQAGAAMVKVFPAKFFGPAYFKEIKGPFKDIKLLACGGVDAANLPEFIAAGAEAVAFGGSIFRKDWMTTAGLPRVEAEIRKLIAAYQKGTEP